MLHLSTERHQWVTQTGKDPGYQTRRLRNGASSSSIFTTFVLSAEEEKKQEIKARKVLLLSLLLTWFFDYNNSMDMKQYAVHQSKQYNLLIRRK